jgi:hypothetical protein
MAAVSATVDFKELGDLLPRLQKAFNAGIIKTVDREARLMLRNENQASLVKFTPPRGINEGKDIGDWAVNRDVNRVFVQRGTIAAILRRTRGASSAFNRYIRQGQYEEAKDFLNGQKQGSVQVAGYTRNGKQVKGYTQKRSVSNLGDNRLGYISHIANEPSKMLHKSRRGSAGRVRREQWSQVVLRKPPLKQYIEQLQKRVGTMKAGWRFAAQALGVSLPPYVNSATNKVNGSFATSSASSGPWAAYWVEMINTTPRIDRMLTQAAVNWLVGHRQRNMEQAIKHRLGEAVASNK